MSIRFRLTLMGLYVQEGFYIRYTYRVSKVADCAAFVGKLTLPEISDEDVFKCVNAG